MQSGLLVPQRFGRLDGAEHLGLGRGFARQVCDYAVPEMFGTRSLAIRYLMKELSAHAALLRDPGLGQAKAIDQVGQGFSHSRTVVGVLTKVNKSDVCVLTKRNTMSILQNMSP